jgi:predicted HicB family RNase H-like nuclease
MAPAQGKPLVMLSIRIDPKLRRQAKQLAVREGTTIQKLVTGAIRDLVSTGRKLSAPPPSS